MSESVVWVRKGRNGERAAGGAGLVLRLYLQGSQAATLGSRAVPRPVKPDPVPSRRRRLPSRQPAVPGLQRSGAGRPAAAGEAAPIGPSGALVSHGRLPGPAGRCVPGGIRAWNRLSPGGRPTRGTKSRPREELERGSLMNGFLPSNDRREGGLDWERVTSGRSALWRPRTAERHSILI